MAMARHQLLAAATCRRARIVVPRAYAYAAPQIRNHYNPSKSASPNRQPPRGRKKPKPDVARGWENSVGGFQQMVVKAKSNIGKLDIVADQYQHVASMGLVDKRTTVLLAELLQIRLRGRINDAILGPIFDFADRLVADMRGGNILTSRMASIRLISMCKEVKDFRRGKRYWKSFCRVDDAVDAGVYGAYIELLTEERVASLDELESLYQEALARFPGTFAAYHLSHNAILPDRTKTHGFAGLSALLLQGIITARLEHGDWKNAYLGLDTAFRIWPSQVPARFRVLFRRYRPAEESYRVFMMACRSGASPITMGDVISHTTNIRDLIRDAPLDERPKILSRTLDMLYAYVGYGGQPTHHVVAALMKLLESIVPSSYERTSEGQKVADLIAQTAREIYRDLTETISASFVSLASRIHLVGKTMCLKELGLAMMDIRDTRESGGEPAGSLERNVLLAAGKIRHPDLIKEAWADLKAAVPVLQYEDFTALAVACRDAECKAFFWEEYSGFSGSVHPDAGSAIISQLDWKFDSTKRHSSVFLPILPLETVQNTMKELKEKVSIISKLLREKKTLNFHNEPIPTDMDGVRVGTEDAMRVVYDKLTTDPLASPPSEDARYQKRFTSSTGIPLGELRFLNWVTLTELLSLAEKNEQYKASLPADAKPCVWNHRSPGAFDSPISDPDQLLAEVKRLRNIDEPRMMAEFRHVARL